MSANWINDLILLLRTLSQILAAGIAITAFSLWLYALAFNLHDRVVRSFMLIMVCVVIVFTTDAIGSTAKTPQEIQNWLQLQWLGIIYLPPAYLQFSDAVLATTGKPSRGKRKWLVRISYLGSTGFLVLLPLGLLVGKIVQNSGPAAYLEPTVFTQIFTLYYAGAMAASLYNLIRAYRRALSENTHRRLMYLMVGAAAPAIGSFPFLLFSSDITAKHNLFFWAGVCLMDVITGGMIVLMAYAVAFFGVSWPDRVIKSRLFKWIMRGPVTAAITLALTTLLHRMGTAFGFDTGGISPILMVLTILMMEYSITLFAPLWERVLFYGKDYESIELMQSVSERLATHNDLTQYLDAVLAAAVDRFQTDDAFIAGIVQGKPEILLSQGNIKPAREYDLAGGLNRICSTPLEPERFYQWDGYCLQPLYDPDAPDVDQKEILGILGIHLGEGVEITDKDDFQSLQILSHRAGLAIRDSRMQEQVLKALRAINQQVDEFQRMQAETRFASTESFLSEDLSPQTEVNTWVRDALTHFWGGPKLSENPLIQLGIVQDELAENDQNPSNALRAVLRKAIDRLRPEGERRLTGEWILYNILELKFIEGRKVREVALRLSMSEADLYRKQRVAIETVAREILELESQRSLRTSLAPQEGEHSK